MAVSSALSTSNQYIKYKIYVNSVSQDIAANKTRVEVKVEFYRTNSYESWGSGTVYCKIDGTTYSASVSPSQRITSAGIVLFSRTQDISHGSDGKKTLSVSAWISHDVVTSSEQGFSVTLTTIPRASSLDSFTCSTSYLDGTFTYKYTPKSSSFYNRLRISIPSVVQLTTLNLGQKSASQQTATFTLNSGLLQTIYNRYPNQATSYIGIVIETYSNSGYTTKVGESSELKINLNFPTSVRPSISAVAISEGGGFGDHFGGIYVQNKSKLRVAITAAGVYGSTISKYETTISGQTYTGGTITSNVITASGSLAVTTKVTDSRGRTYSVNNNVTVAAYESPRVTAFSAFRADASGEPLDEGKRLNMAVAFSISPINNLNDNDWSIEYRRQAESSWTEYTSGQDYVVDTDYLTGELFGVDYTYILRLSITDFFGTYDFDLQIPTSFNLVDYNASGRGIEFGAASEEDCFGVSMPAKFRKGFIASNLQFGRERITPVANTLTSVYVEFEHPFEVSPTVVATPETSVIETTVKGFSISDITTEGFTAWVYRTNTTNTWFSWIAIGQLPAGD